MEAKTFSKVTKITMKGGGDIQIDADGKFWLNNKDSIDEDMIRQQGEELIIEGSSCSINNNSIIMNGNSFSVHGNNISNVCVGDNSTCYINGIKVDLNKLKDFEADDDGDDTEKKWFYLSEGEISSINIKGSGNIFVDKNWMSTSCLLAVSGSGGIKLPVQEYQNVSANLTGSGDISGNNSKVSILNTNLCGSGDIRKFRVTQTGILNLTGSGDIKVNKESGAQIVKNKIGSGDIKVR